MVADFMRLAGEILGLASDLEKSDINRREALAKYNEAKARFEGVVPDVLAGIEEDKRQAEEALARRAQPAPAPAPPEHH